MKKEDLILELLAWTVAVSISVALVFMIKLILT